MMKARDFQFEIGDHVRIDRIDSGEFGTITAIHTLANDASWVEAIEVEFEDESFGLYRPEDCLLPGQKPSWEK